MTENEAEKFLSGSYVMSWGYELEVKKIAVKALKEIQKYHETGMTAEQINEMQKDYVVKSQLFEEYRAIGTVDECRGAMKKQRGKSVITETEDDREYEDLICPNCKIILYQRLKGANDLFLKFKYCYQCGQKLDWGGMTRGKQENVYNENSGQ